MTLGRIIFGASAVLYGVVTLVWPGSDLWGQLHALPAPLGAIVAWCLGIAQVAAGIGMLLPQTARFASIVLGIVFLLFALDNVPGMFVAPFSAVPYINFFEQFAVVCGALVVYGSSSFGQFARLALGLCAISFAWAQLVYFQYTASLVPKWILPSQTFWTILTTIAFALAAIAMLINIQARLATLLMALMIALFGVLVWVTHIIAKPNALGNWSELGLNFLIVGAAWLVAESKNVR